MFAQKLLAQEPLIRSLCFFGILAIMALWESLAPHRPLLIAKSLRWGSNLGLVLLNTLLLRAVFPLAPVGFAEIATVHNWGLFHWLDLPPGLAIPLTIIALDLVIYGQHVAFHAFPILWRLHQVHHADRDFDVTTGLRFHPCEIFLSMGIKIGAIALLGATPVAVLIFEVLLNGTAMFNHGNVSLPPWLDRPLRWVLVTPDMHRVHHSIIPEETNSNYGFNSPWWDYLFRTYRATPAQGDEGMTIGLEAYQTSQQVAQLPWMLLLPFRPWG
ncbi:sterol desaturase family protein [Spirulina sp. CCNP1310]|uniref:sterol desaturase family protein n=1 Tax=Spirulina sp. CCNP1310 TaxID=3110249 RepID=UPI002B1F4756|nr:sterol desaturase family protein [Spirulina sp. CCNP1310]MEA5419627.1 sterol desaturase family protein [Spirulina sp. CCNP1310]